MKWKNRKKWRYDLLHINEDIKNEKVATADFCVLFHVKRHDLWAKFKKRTLNAMYFNMNRTQKEKKCEHERTQNQ